ncbi:uncharacterized protein VTP21DRAFT_10766 [Calcarisporiella thermophila]|uniref:uncharacterized protein n=1 Tax=Calcarisporiella thermophila TaxID=911321 RepID=UPI00374322DF
MKKPASDPTVSLWASISLLNLTGKYAPEGYGTAIFATTFSTAKLKRKGGFWFNQFQTWRMLGGSPVASPNWTATEVLSLPLYKCPLITDEGRQMEEPKPPTPPYLLNEILTFVRWGGQIECRSLHNQALFDRNIGRQSEMERRYSALPIERLRNACHRRYCSRSLGWELRYLNLPPSLVAKVTECTDIPQQHPHPRFPLYHCHLAGRPVVEYSTRQGRHFRRNGSLEPNILVPQSWPEAGSTPEDWKKIWTSVHKRPTLPKHRALRWRILVERVITNSTFPGHDPKCTRCNASRDTIRHTFFECPELTPVWQWAERCIVTITGPQNTPVLTTRNLILGDLTESTRTARHVARITFDSVLWQIHRDRIAFHFESTRASPEIIISRAKLDIEEVIGAELIRARKNRQIEQFRRRWCKLGAVREGAIGAALILG